MSWSFFLNLLLAVFGIRQAWNDHGATYAEWLTAVGQERRRKLEKLIILWGVPIASVVMLPFTWSDNRAIDNLSGSHETATNRLAIAEEKLNGLDPLSQPISEITGRATVELMGSLPGQPPAVIGVHVDSSVILMESNAPPNTLNFGGQNVLYAADITAHYTTSTGPTTHTYAMNLKCHPSFLHGSVQVIADFSPATTGAVMDRINWTQLKLGFVPPKSEILNGSVEIAINGTSRKQFGIPRQVCAADGTFYATNIVAR